MIGRLAGRVDVVADDRVILDVGGVGYHLACSARTINALGGSGSESRVLVETFIGVTGSSSTVSSMKPSRRASGS